MISISRAANVDVSLLINLPRFPKGNFFTESQFVQHEKDDLCCLRRVATSSPPSSPSQIVILSPTPQCRTPGTSEYPRTFLQGGPLISDPEAMEVSLCV